MAESENIGSLYVQIKADVSNLNTEVAQLKARLSKDSAEMSKKLTFKAKFDTALAKLRLTELQNLRQKLQREFDKKVSLNVDSASLDRTRTKIASVDQQLQGVGDSAVKASNGFGAMLAKGLLLAGGITAIFRALTNSIQAARDSAIAQAQITRAVITTGQAAGFTAKELFGLAEELKNLTAIDDDQILTDVTNNLLTFKNVSGDVFKRAQLAILDLNAVISKGELGALTSQTIQLGKALNDPIQGISSLTRVGISFTEQQKNQIKTLTETGRLYEAQSIILREIEGQYGGQARVLAESDGGFKKFNQTVDDVNEAIGKDLIGAATEGSGALQELADAFLEVNEAVKVVNQGVGIFGFLIDGLKNVITGGRATLDTIFNIKGLYKTAKDQYIKDMEDAKKKTQEFFDVFGLNPVPFKLTPFNPQYDTTAGDEILKQYQEQQAAIEQIKNKLKDVNLSAAERIVLQKELDSLIKKQSDKTVTTKFVSQIPKNYTAEQVAEYEKLKFAAKGYADYALSVIQTKYENELVAAKGNVQEILKAEEEKALGIAKLNQEILNDLKETGKRMMEETRENTKKSKEEAEQSAKYFKEKQDDKKNAIDKYYSEVGAKDEGYWTYKRERIKNDSDAILLATQDEQLAKQYQIVKLKELEQEYFDWRMGQNELLMAANNSMVEGFTNAFHEIRIRTAADASALENIFADMANSFIREVDRMLAQWLLLQGFSFFLGGGGAFKALGGHTGGNFIGTSSGVKKMAGGGSFIVPPGFPNDSYPLLVESGEKINVQSAASVGMQDRLLKSIDRKLAILNMNTIEGQIRSNKQPGAIPLYGKLDGQDIYISNKRAGKVIGRMS